MDTQDKFSLACREILQMVLDNEVTDTDKLIKAKKQISKKYKLSSLPTNADIIIAGNEEEQLAVRDFLKKKPVRTISGVAVIAAMTSPAPCPHGICVPCPGGPKSSFLSPQSYMGQEPSTMRAIQHAYDPYSITTARLNQLKQIGHDIEKAELIIMGGTYSSRSLDYQEWYTKRCLEAMNDFFDTKWRDTAQPIGFHNPYFTLENVQHANEKAKVRNVGITFETRPDWCKQEHIDILLKLGATKVEIGVQSTYDFVLSKIKRGHTVSDIMVANQVLRDSGLKIGFHMMPHLPGMSFDSDIRNFKKLFSDTRFMPDYLKIYPTLVTEGTELYDMWKKGEYTALKDEDAIELLAKIKSFLPKWVRLQRIQRDIPAHQIIAGTRKSNIRQLAQSLLEKQGLKCRCIRCREVGHNILQGKFPDVNHIELCIEKYEACGGTEYFISFEDTHLDILIGFLRLRLPYKPHRLELQNAAVVRELHVYGSLVPIGSTVKMYDWQHLGYGAKLLSYAEKLSYDKGFNKISIISGIGVREYYRKQGYVQDGIYMSKTL